MTNNNEVSDEMLMALADGELRGADAERLSQLIDRDPLLAERFAAFAETRALLREAYPAEPIPDRLIQAVLRTDAEEASTIVPLHRRVRPAGSIWGMALAASLVLAVGFGGFLVGRGSVPGPVASDPIAAAAVALASLPTGAEVQLPDGQSARALASFDTELGLCRLIGIERARAVVCRSEDGWTTALSVAEGDGAAYLPASDVATGMIDAMLDSIGAGAPLAPEAERAALSR